tara:strand:- start:603 stop:767 length:165 start_codon:yes stop_codon:yes gene_type:complete
MASKQHTIEEQAVIDARTQEVKTEKRNKNLMYIGGTILVAGLAFYIYKNKFKNN